MQFIYSCLIVMSVLVANSIFSDPQYEEELYDVLSSHKFFSAFFEQKTTTNEVERKIQGEIIADRSGRFKITYFDPFNEVISSDGKDIYRYDPELEQAEVQPLDDLLKETPIGLFSLETEELKKIFLLNWCKKIGSIMKCKLSPIKEVSFIREVILDIRNKLIYKLEYKDTFDQNISINFKNPSLKEIPKHKFKFIIPKGTDIVGAKNNLE